MLVRLRERACRNRKKGKRKMEVYRLYVKGECVSTHGDHFSGVIAMNKWFAAGYTAEDCDLKKENF